MGDPSQRLPLSLWIIDSVNANSPQPNRQERHLNPWCSSLNFCAIKSGRETEREALIHSNNVTFLKFLSTAETYLLHMPTFLFIKWSLGQPHLCILRVSPTRKQNRSAAPIHTFICSWSSSTNVSWHFLQMSELLWKQGYRAETASVSWQVTYPLSEVNS